VQRAKINIIHRTPTTNNKSQNTSAITNLPNKANGMASLENPLANSPSSIEWMQTMELSYEASSNPPDTVCFSCGKPPKMESSGLSKCAKCGIASYCSRECQIKDWKEGRHRLACPSYRRLKKLALNNHVTQTIIRNEIFGRIRFYACPYAIFKTQELGNGFLFVQSNNTLQDLSLHISKDTTGRILERSVLMHFLTMGEFDVDLVSDDFEMAAVRTELQKLVSTYNQKKELILLFRSRCGHVALGKGVLVPDYGICKKLGQDYYSENTAGSVQLNLDDI
jgi:hypothetical protein